MIINILGNVYGEGVYFAVDASVSSKYALPDAYGNRYMFYSSVLTGSYSIGTKGITTPPVKNVEALEWFDSVCDNLYSPSMFVIFNDTQAYPSFLVIFQSNSTNTYSSIVWGQPLCESNSTNTYSSMVWGQPLCESLQASR